MIYLWEEYLQISARQIFSTVLTTNTSTRNLCACSVRARVRSFFMQSELRTKERNKVFTFLCVKPNQTYFLDQPIKYQLKLQLWLLQFSLAMFGQFECLWQTLKQKRIEDWCLLRSKVYVFIIQMFFHPSWLQIIIQTFCFAPKRLGTFWRRIWHILIKK